MKDNGGKLLASMEPKAGEVAHPSLDDTRIGTTSSSALSTGTWP